MDDAEKLSLEVIGRFVAASEDIWFEAEDRRVASVPVIFIFNNAEGAPGPSPLGTGEVRFTFRIRRIHN
jgi:hypothetical protein